MSLSGSLLNGVSGLQTSQRQINVTSANVSNANVEGYSRKTAPAVTALTAGQNSGVDLGQVRREVNAYLDGEVRRADTQLGGLDAKTEFMQRITQLFGTLDNDSTLNNGLSDLSAALEQLAIEPNSASVRNDVVEAADALARQFNRFASETTNLRVEADRQIEQGVSEVNGALERIAELNEEISKAYALDRPAGDLEDERDRQLGTLSEWMDVSAFSRENGEIVVMGRTSSGSATTLVDSAAVQFTFDQANALGPTAESGGHPHLLGDPNTELGTVTGGQLGALMELRDDTLTSFHRDIDRLAQSVRDRVNAAHNQGTAGNAGQATITGSVELAGDPIALSTPAEITVNRIAADGTVIASHTVDLAGLGNPATPAQIASQISGAHGDITATVTADDQLQIVAGGTTAGITIDSGAVTLSGNDSGGTERNFSHYFGLNNLFETPGRTYDATDANWDLTNTAGAIQVRDDIKDDPELLARGTARSEAGEPAVADGDQTVAAAMAAAFESKGAIARGGNLPAMSSATLADYASDLLSFYATSAQRTETARDFQATMRDELKFRADSESGVNIDEELSNMIVFEQAYNASARVISTVQQMFDTLDRMMN